MVPLLAFEVVAASTATVHEKCDQDTIYTYISHYEPPQTSGIFNPVLITGIRKFQRQRLTNLFRPTFISLNGERPTTRAGRPLPLVENKWACNRIYSQLVTPRLWYALTIVFSCGFDARARRARH